MTKFLKSLPKVHYQGQCYQEVVEPSGGGPTCGIHTHTSYSHRIRVTSSKSMVRERKGALTSTFCRGSPRGTWVYMPVCEAWRCEFLQSQDWGQSLERPLGPQRSSALLTLSRAQHCPFSSAFSFRDSLNAKEENLKKEKEAVRPKPHPWLKPVGHGPIDFWEWSTTPCEGWNTSWSQTTRMPWLLLLIKDTLVYPISL
jgi:hypothetical protein